MKENVGHHKTPALIDFDLEQLNIKIVSSICELRDVFIGLKSTLKKKVKTDAKHQEVLASYASIFDSDLYKDLLPEMILSRTVDNFHNYLSDVLFILFRSRPETLRSSEKVTVEEVLSANTMNEFVEDLAERRVESLSYKGFSSIYRYLIDQIGIRPGLKQPILDGAIQAIALRNIIVHNRSRVSARFLKETKRADVKSGDTITVTIAVAQEHIVSIESIAIGIDALLTEKFGDACFHKFCKVKNDSA
jgi:hypothetical protein